MFPNGKGVMGVLSGCGERDSSWCYDEFWYRLVLFKTRVSRCEVRT